MPRMTFPTRRELARMERPLIFIDLLAEARTWEGGFTTPTPDPVPPTFVEDLRAQHYPQLPSFEVRDDLEVIEVTETAGEYAVIVG
jgi:hypothetical protein